MARTSSWNYLVFLIGPLRITSSLSERLYLTKTTRTSWFFSLLEESSRAFGKLCYCRVFQLYISIFIFLGCTVALHISYIVIFKFWFLLGNFSFGPESCFHCVDLLMCLMTQTALPFLLQILTFTSVKNNFLTIVSCLKNLHFSHLCHLFWWKWTVTVCASSHNVHCPEMSLVICDNIL